MLWIQEILIPVAILSGLAIWHWEFPKFLGLDEHLCEKIHIAAHLHDIGKMYDSKIGKIVLENWDKIIAVLK